MATIQERYTLLEAASRDKGLQQELIRLCKADPIFWFNHFCWTFNPRVLPSHMPFNLFPFQEQLVTGLCECIDFGEPALIEKSRDMGLTWIVLLVFQYYWLFRDGADFHCGSKREDNVDKRGVRSTLFQKFRYNADRLPTWMVPKLRPNREDNNLRIINPLNGNALTGESATIDFGRGDRYLAMLLDEFSRHPYGKASYESATQSTDCIFLLFTPYGTHTHANTLSKSPTLLNYPLFKDNPPEAA